MHWTGNWVFFVVFLHVCWQFLRLQVLEPELNQLSQHGINKLFLPYSTPHLFTLFCILLFTQISSDCHCDQYACSFQGQNNTAVTVRHACLHLWQSKSNISMTWKATKRDHQFYAYTKMSTVYTSVYVSCECYFKCILLRLYESPADCCHQSHDQWPQPVSSLRIFETKQWSNTAQCLVTQTLTISYSLPHFLDLQVVRWLQAQCDPIALKLNSVEQTVLLLTVSVIDLLPKKSIFFYVVYSFPGFSNQGYNVLDLFDFFSFFCLSAHLLAS